MQHKILCYGDSNTWGQVAYQHVRLPDAQQWPHILAAKLGHGWRIDQQGLSGRVAGHHDAQEPEYNGHDTFLLALRPAWPLTHIVIALGLNDLKKRYGRSAEDIASDLGWYVEATAQEATQTGLPMPHLYFVVPTPFRAPADYFDADESTRQRVITLMQQQLPHVIDPGAIDLSEDGVHISPTGHEQLAQKIYEVMTHEQEQL